MPSTPETTSASDRRIGIRLGPRGVAPRVIAALRTLGYSLIDPDVTPDMTDSRVWLVDADRFGELPSVDAAPDLRVLLIAPPSVDALSDPRIIAQTPRPGRLSSVYAMVQTALERTPRKCPRIPTRLSARCIRSDRRSIGAVLSLSEGGCLLRTRESLRKGAKLDVQFALPDYGLVSTRAECVYTRRGDAGLSFATPPPDVRFTIAHFITHQLANKMDSDLFAQASSA